MNANRYRLIFDKRTGMLVPVAEFTSSAKKGSSRGIGDGMGDTSTPKWSQLCFAMALAASGLGAPRVLNAQMIPDGTTQTTVTQTSNGLPLVNIADPNASGLSHNKFTDFNVDARGAVFNNSQVDANTRMGGQALKNPHLTNNASAILTEITGNNTSHLLGSMEVHGAPADLIIANPNGIFVNDVAVLGANNLTLTTGKPDALGRKFEVHGGNIEIGAGGLSTENLNYFDIVARSIALHGEIQGGANAEGRLAAGLNTLDRGTADRPITKREDGGGAGAPAFAIQGSAVGAMHGSHVTLLSTESGVGVRHEGRIISSTDIQIDVNGDLRVRRMEAQQNAFLKGHNVSLGGEGDTMEAPSAKVNHWLRVNAEGDLRLQGIYNLEKAQFTATGTLTSEGAHVNALRREYNTHGRIDATAGAIDILGGQWSASTLLYVNAGAMNVSSDAQISTRDGYIDVTGTLDNKGTIAADNGGSYTFDVGQFTNRFGAQVQAAYIWMTAGLLDNFGSVVGRQELDIELGAGESNNAGTLRSTEGDIEITGVSAILRNSGQITAEEGSAFLQLAALYNLNTLKTKHYIEATIAQGLDNTGTINTRDIDIVAGWLRNSGGNAAIDATGFASLLIAGNAENLSGAKILGADGIALTANNIRNDSAAIGAGTEKRQADLLIQARGSIDNASGAEMYGTLVQIEATGNLRNTDGQIRGDLTEITAGGALANDGGTIRGDMLLDIDAGADILNRRGAIQGGDTTIRGGGALINTQGRIHGSSVDIAVGDVILNDGAEAKIASDTTLDLVGKTLDNDAGLVQGGGNVVVTLDGPLNNVGGGTIASGATLDVLAKSVDNETGHMSGRDVVLNVAGDLRNVQGATIKADNVLDANIGGDLESADAGSQITGSTALLKVAGNASNIDGALIQASDALSLNAQRLANTGGAKILSGTTGGTGAGDMEITLSQGDLDNTDGAHIVATGRAWIDAEGRLENRNNAKIAADRVAIDVKTGGVLNDATSSIDGITMVDIKTPTDLRNDGRIGADFVYVDAKQRADNTGRIVGGKQVWIDTTAFDNTATGAIEAKDYVDIKTIGYRNVGKIFSDGDVTLTIKDGHDLTLDNTAHNPIALGTLTINADDIDVNRELANPGNIHVFSTGWFQNDEGVVSGKSFRAKVAKYFDNPSLVWAQEDVDIRAHSLLNHSNAEIEAGADLILDVETTLVNQVNARIAAGDDGYIDARELRNEMTWQGQIQREGGTGDEGGVWRQHPTFGSSGWALDIGHDVRTNPNFNMTTGLPATWDTTRYQMYHTGQGVRLAEGEVVVTGVGVIETGGDLRINESTQHDKGSSIINSGHIRAGGTLSLDGNVRNLAPIVEMTIEEFLKHRVDITLKTLHNHMDLDGDFLPGHSNNVSSAPDLDEGWSGNIHGYLPLSKIATTYHSLYDLFEGMFSDRGAGQLQVTDTRFWQGALTRNVAMNKAENWLPHLQSVTGTKYSQVMTHVFGPDWRTRDYTTMHARWREFRNNIWQKPGFTAVGSGAAEITAGGNIFTSGGGFESGTGSKRLENKPLTVTIDGKQVETIAGNFDVLRNLEGLTQAIDPARALAHLTRDGQRKFQVAPPSKVILPALPSIHIGGGDGLVEVTPPGAPVHPIYETRIEFIDQSKFYGSHYFFRSIGYNPDRTVTVIGDNYFINELVTRQMSGQIANFMAVQHKVGGAEIVQKLMDNAGVENLKLGLTVGVSPTEEQLAKLEHDIVWFVEQDVNGVKALVPQVFLSKKTVAAIDELRASGVALVNAGGNVAIDADKRGVQNNDGTIRAGKTLVIESKGKVSNSSRAGLKNGGLRAGEDLLIDAKGDVENIGAEIKAGRHGQILTDGDFTDTVRMGYDDKGRLVVKNQSQLRGGGAEEGESRKIPKWDDLNKPAPKPEGVVLVEIKPGTYRPLDEGELEKMGKYAVYQSVDDLDAADGGKIWKVTYDEATAKKDKEKFDAEQVAKYGKVPEGSFSINAKGSVKLIASDIRAKDVSIKAGKDILVGDVHEVRSEYEFQQERTDLLTTRSAERRLTEAKAKGARIQGNNNGGSLVMHAGRNVVLEGGEYGADLGSIRGKNVITTTSKDYRHEEVKSTVSGLALGGRTSFIGYGAGGQVGGDAWSGTSINGQESGDGHWAGQPGDDGDMRKAMNGRANPSGKSVLGETAGGRVGFQEVTLTQSHSQIKNRNAQLNFGSGVEIIGENRVDIGGADIRAWKGEGDNIQKGQVYIEGGEVVATKYRDVDKTTMHVKDQFVGLNASASSSLVDFANKRAETARAAQSGLKIDRGMETASVAGDVSNLVFNDLGAVSAGVNFSQSEESQSMDTGKQNVNNLVGNIVVKSTKGDIDLAGVILDGRGGSVILDSAAKLRLGSAQSSEKGANESKSVNINLGVDAGVGAMGTGLGASGGYTEEKSKGSSSGMSNTNSKVMGDYVMLRSKGDTTLAGANVIGGLVQTDIGGKLEIFSQQDTYDSQTEREDFSVSGGAGAGVKGGNAGFNRGTGKDWEKRRVTTEQSGIVAGHLDLKVKGDVHMKGSHMITKTGTSDVGGKLIAETIKDTIEKDGRYNGGGAGVGASNKSFKSLKHAAKALGPNSGNYSGSRSESHYYDADQLVTISGIDINAKGGTVGEVNKDVNNMVRVNMDERIAGTEIAATVSPNDMADLVRSSRRRGGYNLANATPGEGPTIRPIPEQSGFGNTFEGDESRTHAVSVEEVRARFDDVRDGPSTSHIEREVPVRSAEKEARPGLKFEDSNHSFEEKIVRGQKAGAGNSSQISGEGSRLASKIERSRDQLVEENGRLFVKGPDGKATSRYAEVGADGKTYEVGRVTHRDDLKPQERPVEIADRDPHRTQGLKPSDTGTAAIDTRQVMQSNQAFDKLPRPDANDPTQRGERLHMRPTPVDADKVVEVDGHHRILGGAPEGKPHGNVLTDNYAELNKSKQWFQAGSVARDASGERMRPDPSKEVNRGTGVAQGGWVDNPDYTGHGGDNNPPEPFRSNQGKARYGDDRGTASVDNGKHSGTIYEERAKKLKTKGKKLKSTGLTAKDVRKKLAELEALDKEAAPPIATRVDSDMAHPPATRTAWEDTGSDHRYKTLVAVDEDGATIVGNMPLSQDSDIELGRRQAERDAQDPPTNGRVPTTVKRDRWADFTDKAESAKQSRNAKSALAATVADASAEAQAASRPSRKQFGEGKDTSAAITQKTGDVEMPQVEVRDERIARVGAPVAEATPPSDSSGRGSEVSDSASNVAFIDDSASSGRGSDGDSASVRGIDMDPATLRAEFDRVNADLAKAQANVQARTGGRATRSDLLADPVIAKLHAERAALESQLESLQGQAAVVANEVARRDMAEAPVDRQRQIAEDTVRYVYDEGFHKGRNDTDYNNRPVKAGIGELARGLLKGKSKASINEDKLARQQARAAHELYMGALAAEAGASGESRTRFDGTSSRRKDEAFDEVFDEVFDEPEMQPGVPVEKLAAQKVDVRAGFQRTDTMAKKSAQRVLIVEQEGEDVEDAVTQLRKRYPNLVVMRVGPDRKLKLDSGKFKPGKSANVIMLGHGYRDEQHVGYKYPPELADQVVELQEKHGLKVNGIEMIVCQAAACDRDNVSIAKRLKYELTERHIDAELKAHVGKVGVDESGGRFSDPPVAAVIDAYRDRLSKRYVDLSKELDVAQSLKDAEQSKRLRRELVEVEGEIADLRGWMHARARLDGQKQRTDASLFIGPDDVPFERVQELAKNIRKYVSEHGFHKGRNDTRYNNDPVNAGIGERIKGLLHGKSKKRVNEEKLARQQARAERDLLDAAVAAEQMKRKPAAKAAAVVDAPSQETAQSRGTSVSDTRMLELVDAQRALDEARAAVDASAKPPIPKRPARLRKSAKGDDVTPADIDEALAALDAVIDPALLPPPVAPKPRMKTSDTQSASGPDGKGLELANAQRKLDDARARWDAAADSVDVEVERLNALGGDLEVRMENDPEFIKRRAELDDRSVELERLERSMEHLRAEAGQLRGDPLKSIPMRGSKEDLLKDLAQVEIADAALFDRIPEGRITALVMERYDIGMDFMAVRVQDNKFTDFKRGEIRGHAKPVASVMDIYNPTRGISRTPMGKSRPADKVVAELDLEALNVMLVPKDQVEATIKAGMYAGVGKSWVSFPVREALEMGARLYPDTSSSVRTGDGQPFVIALPKGTSVPVEIADTRRKSNADDSEDEQFDNLESAGSEFESLTRTHADDATSVNDVQLEALRSSSNERRASVSDVEMRERDDSDSDDDGNGGGSGGGRKPSVGAAETQAAANASESELANVQRARDDANDKWLAAVQALNVETERVRVGKRGDFEARLEADPAYQGRRAELDIRSKELERLERSLEVVRAEAGQLGADPLKSIPMRGSKEDLLKDLAQVDIPDAALFDRIPDGRLTAMVMDKFDIGMDYVAVRVQDDRFTDFKRREIRGHVKPVASVMDIYNPTRGMTGTPTGKSRPAVKVVAERGMEALNVMLVAKDQVETTIKAGAYALAGRSWVTFPVRDALELGARLYPDTSSQARSGNGQPFVIALPKGTRVPVDIPGSVGSTSVSDARKRMRNDGTVEVGDAQPKASEVLKGLLHGKDPKRVAEEKTERQRARFKLSEELRTGQGASNQASTPVRFGFDGVRTRADVEEEFNVAKAGVIKVQKAIGNVVERVEGAHGGSATREQLEADPEFAQLREQKKTLLARMDRLHAEMETLPEVARAPTQEKKTTAPKRLTKSGRVADGMAALTLGEKFSGMFSNKSAKQRLEEKTKKEQDAYARKLRQDEEDLQRKLLQDEEDFQKGLRALDAEVARYDVAPDTGGDTYGHRVLVAEDSSPKVMEAVRRLQGKHPETTTSVYTPFEGGLLREPSSQRPRGKVAKVQLVGDGNSAERTLSGRGAGELADQVAHIQRQEDVDVAKVVPVGCETNVCGPDGRSLATDLDGALRERGVETTVHGTLTPVRVDPTGKKIATVETHPDALSDDKPSFGARLSGFFRGKSKHKVADDQAQVKPDEFVFANWSDGAMRLVGHEELPLDVRHAIANLRVLNEQDFVDGRGNARMHLLLRGDLRAPGEIFKNGMRPRDVGKGGKVGDVLGHVHGDRRTGMVSTSKSGTVAAEYAGDGNGGWVYVVQGKGGIDVNQWMAAEDRRSMYGGEYEVLVDGIDGSNIVGAYRVNRGGAYTTDSFVPNPNFRATPDANATPDKPKVATRNFRSPQQPLPGASQMQAKSIAMAKSPKSNSAGDTRDPASPDSGAANDDGNGDDDGNGGGSSGRSRKAANNEGASGGTPSTSPVTSKQALENVRLQKADKKALLAELAKIDIDDADLFDRIPDGRITALVMAQYDIDIDYVAVRTQHKVFTDFERGQVRGHQDTTAAVRDPYNPRVNVLGRPVGPERDSDVVMRESDQEGLNVMLVPKEEVTALISRGHYGGPDSTFVTFPLREALERGARLYPDESSMVRPDNGYPFMIALPKGTQMPVSIPGAARIQDKHPDSTEIAYVQPDNSVVLETGKTKAGVAEADMYPEVKGYAKKLAIGRDGHKGFSVAADAPGTLGKDGDSSNEPHASMSPEARKSRTESEVALFNRIPDGHVTAKVMWNYGVSLDDVAVRGQGDAFTDFERSEVRGHQGTTATVSDPYNPLFGRDGNPVPHVRHSEELMRETGQEGLNVFLVPKEDVGAVMATRHYAPFDDTTYVTFPLREALERNARLYYDVRAVPPVESAAPFLIALPKGTTLPVTTHPTPPSIEPTVVGDVKPERFGQRAVLFLQSPQSMQMDPNVFRRRWQDKVLMANVRDDGSIDVDTTNLVRGAQTQLQVVGDVDFDAQTIGGMRPDQVAAQAWKIQSRLGLDLRELKLVGCETSKCTPTGSSIVRSVESEMGEFDVYPEVKGYPEKIYVDGKGRKRPGPREDYVVGSGLLGKQAGEPIASMSLATMQSVGAKPAGAAEGGIFRDESNQQWFVKGANGNEDFARNEVLAAKLLQMAGVPVPEVRTIDLGDAFGGGVGVASKAIDGARPVNWINDDAARSAVRRDFAAHAFIGNWDAIGQNGDNYVTDQGGIVYSIDHGGALRYRAQGEPKGTAFGKRVSEIESMRDPLQATEMSAKVFGKVSYDELRLGVERVVWMSDEGIRLMVEAHGPRDPGVRKELLDTLLARKAYFAAALDAMGPGTSELGWRRPGATRNAWREPLPESLVPGVSVVIRHRLANLDRLANADFVDAAGNSKLPLLFRGDDREPGEIFLEGFRPRARWPQAHANLRSHQIGAGWLKSNLVSTSRGPDTAAAFAINNSDKEGWLYVMHGQKGLDVNERVGENSSFAKELEIVVPDGISREMIVGAYKVRTGGIVADSFQPNPHFEARFDPTHLHGLRKELSDEHNEALRTWEELTARGDADGALRVAPLIAGIQDALTKVERDLAEGARREANRREFTDIHLPADPGDYTRRVVIAEETDPDVMRSAEAIRDKHMENSVLVAPDTTGLATLVGDDEKQDGWMKVQVLSHNRNGLMGDRTAEEIAQHVVEAKRKFGGEVGKVTLVACDTAACGKTQLRAILDDMRTKLGGKSALVDALESMSQDVGGRDTVDDVVKALRSHGIDASVVGREGAVYVGFDGSKRLVARDTEGALGLPNLGTHATDGIAPPMRLQDMQRVADKAMRSTWPGAVYRDGDGWKWFVKSTGNDEDYARNEVLAGRLLVMAGVRVTETRLIDLGDELGGGIGIASRGVPGAQSVDLYKDAAARAAVREHFVAHAFIANWDAIGITGGNYVRDAAGALVSIDHGGALRYRGAGAPKGSAFESTVGEMQSMLKKDPLTKHIFRELSLAEVRAGLKRVVAIPDAAILSLVERYGPHDDAARAELGRTLLARKADLRAYQEKLGEPPADLAKVQAAERARGEAFLRAQSEEVAAASNVLSSLTADELGMLETLHERNWTDFMDKRGEQTTKFDFRGDSRKPSEIFARGFEPWARWPNADADTAAHQKEVDRERSNIVSLSKLPSRATGFATNFGTRTEGHLYVTHGLKGLDLFRRLPISIRSFEHEIAVPDGVPPHHILGAYDVDLKGIVPGSFQVNPGFETEADRAGFAARQKTLLGHHALVASSLDDVQDQSWWHREPGLEAMLRDHRASLEWRLEGLYREQKDSARREANRREFTDTTLKE